MGYRVELACCGNLALLEEGLQPGNRFPPCDCWPVHATAMCVVVLDIV